MLIQWLSKCVSRRRRRLRCCWHVAHHQGLMRCLAAAAAATAAAAGAYYQWVTCPVMTGVYTTSHLGWRFCRYRIINSTCSLMTVHSARCWFSHWCFTSFKHYSPLTITLEWQTRCCFSRYAAHPPGSHITHCIALCLSVLDSKNWKSQIVQLWYTWYPWQQKPDLFYGKRTRALGFTTDWKKIRHSFLTDGHRMLKFGGNSASTDCHIIRTEMPRSYHISVRPYVVFGLIERRTCRVWIWCMDYK